MRAGWDMLASDFSLFNLLMKPGFKLEMRKGN